MEENTVISTVQLDEILQEVVAARARHDEAKKVAAEVYKEREAAEAKLIETMQKAEKTKWGIDGVGKVSLVMKLSVKVPQTPEDNKKLFEYVMGKYGEDVAMKRFSFNSKSLQSFYREEFEAAEDKSLFTLPGVEEPTSNPELRLTKD